MEERFKQLSKISQSEDLPVKKIYMICKDYIESLDKETYHKYFQNVRNRVANEFEIHITGKRNSEHSVIAIDAINMYLAARENKSFKINENGELEIDVFPKLGENKYDYILKSEYIYQEEEEILEGLDDYY